MTLAHRNNLIKIALIFLIGLSIFVSVLGVFLLTSKKDTLKIYTDITMSIENDNALNLFLFKENKKLFVVQNILYPIYAFLILLAVYFLFEKTYVIEISFFICFAIFFSLEGLKLLVPFFDLWTFSPKLVLIISKTLYFFRLTMIFTLLSAAVFIVVPFTRRITPILFGIFFLSTALTTLTPFNTENLTKHFLLADGLQKLTIGAFWFFSFAIVLTYFIAGKTLNANEYVTASWSMFLLLVGCFITITTLSIISFILANAMIVTGVLFYLRSIHLYNLWQ